MSWRISNTYIKPILSEWRDKIREQIKTDNRAKFRGGEDFTTVPMDFQFKFKFTDAWVSITILVPIFQVVLIVCFIAVFSRVTSQEATDSVDDIDAEQLALAHEPEIHIDDNGHFVLRYLCTFMPLYAFTMHFIPSAHVAHFSRTSFEIRGNILLHEKNLLFKNPYPPHIMFYNASFIQRSMYHSFCLRSVNVVFLKKNSPIRILGTHLLNRYTIILRLYILIVI